MNMPGHHDHEKEKNPDKFSGHRRDGSVELSVAEDKLSLDLTLYPAIGDGQILDRDSIEKILEAEKITCEVRWEAVTEGIFECNTGHKPITLSQAAAGIKPVSAWPEHIVLEPKFSSSPLSLDTESLRVDYKAISPYIFVKKNEKLGTVVPARAGEPGKNVYGEEVPAGKADVTVYTPGANVVVAEGAVTAGCDGRFERTETGFSVNEVLSVKGDIDYHTGHVLFPGDIAVEGTVREGFKVVAGGSILCSELLEASDISAKKDITVGFGILGRKKGLVRAGGEIRAKFIENCTVKAKGPVIISDSILNSRIFTLDRVDLGDKGRILGGLINAVNGVTAFQAGNAAMQVTGIKCGVNFVAEEKLEEVKRRHFGLSLKLQKAESLLRKEEYRKSRDELTEVIGKLKEAINQVTAAMNVLLGKIHGNEAAEIIVKDALYPGVTLEICHVTFIVIEVMKKVRFRLDKERGKLVND